MQDILYGEVREGVLMKYDMPECPICGEDCNEFYVNGREIVGCEHCISTESAWERMEEDRESAQIDRAYDYHKDRGYGWDTEP